MVCFDISNQLLIVRIDYSLLIHYLEGLINFKKISLWSLVPFNILRDSLISLDVLSKNGNGENMTHKRGSYNQL